MTSLHLNSFSSAASLSTSVPLSIPFGCHKVEVLCLSAESSLTAFHVSFLICCINLGKALVWWMLIAAFLSACLTCRMSAIKSVRSLLRSCTWLLSNCCCPSSTWLFSPCVPRTQWRSAALMLDSASSKTFPSAESTLNKTHLLRVSILWGQAYIWLI